MGRPERSIDPEAGPVAEFARDLRRLRDSSGRPSYRELARKAGLSVTVLSDAAGGQRLPTRHVVKGYVGACGGDIAEFDGAVLLATPDISCTRHGESFVAPASNVIFEYGYLSSRLTRRRVVICRFSRA